MTNSTTNPHIGIVNLISPAPNEPSFRVQLSGVKREPDMPRDAQLLVRNDGWRPIGLTHDFQRMVLPEPGDGEPTCAPVVGACVAVLDTDTEGALPMVAHVSPEWTCGNAWGNLEIVANRLRTMEPVQLGPDGPLPHLYEVPMHGENAEQAGVASILVHWRGDALIYWRGDGDPWRLVFESVCHGTDALVWAESADELVWARDVELDESWQVVRRRTDVDGVDVACSRIHGLRAPEPGFYRYAGEEHGWESAELVSVSLSSTAAPSFVGLRGTKTDQLVRSASLPDDDERGYGKHYVELRQLTRSVKSPFPRFSLDG